MEERTLEQRIAELEAKAKGEKEEKAEEKPFVLKEPWKRYDPTEGFRLPASAVKAMVDVVPDMRGIAMEQKRISTPGILPVEGAVAVERGSGWREPAKLEPPPGISIMDEMMNVQDEVDRIALERRLGVKRRV
jgi:hypothetical protein